MADIEQLGVGVRALFPAAAYPHFGKVKPGTELPWTLVLLSLPSPSERRLTGRISNRRCLMRVRFCGANDTAVRQVADIALPLLEDTRPEAPGWRCTPLRQLGDDARIYTDEDTKLADGTRPLVAAVDFEFYVTEITD